MTGFSDRNRFHILAAAFGAALRKSFRLRRSSENPLFRLSALLCCLLLAGCGATSPGTEIPVSREPPAALYAPASPMEQKTRGAVRTYPLPMENVRGVRAMGADLLIFSDDGLSLLTGEGLIPAASAPVILDPADPSIVVTDDALSFYDPDRMATLVLDRSLREVRAIAAPQDMVGSPILSRDGKTLYYATANALRAWDLTSGLRRMLKAVPGASLTALHEDSVLQCTVGNSAMLLSGEDGRLLRTADQQLNLTTRKGQYFASLPAGLNQLFLFGSEAPRTLMTADFNAGDCFFLPDRNAAVTAVTGRETILSYYDLGSGRRSSILSLPSQEPPQVVAAADGLVYVLASDEHYPGKVLYRWDTAALPATDTGFYTFPYFSAETPDREGLAQCRAYAEEISGRYGIRVLIGKEAADTQPWDYDFEPEHLTPFLQQELELLDECLSHYPKSVLEDTVSHFSSLTVCLVRSITGTAASGSLDAANGLQFFDGTDVYLALAVSPQSDHPFYHELFHVMETHLLGGSTAFDQWDNINPPDFTYSYRYEEPKNREWLQGERRAFIDSYSTTFPKEDRARIMEYAMTPGNGELFRHKILQAKLEVLCRAIRQAYDLKKSPEVFLWEQYLNTPMAYSK